MAKWTKACGVDTVVLESTGVYWIPVFRVLEEHGLNVLLVDARHVKHVPGRKTDVADCQNTCSMCFLGGAKRSNLLRGSRCLKRLLRCARNDSLSMVNSASIH